MRVAGQPDAGRVPPEGARKASRSSLDTLDLTSSVLSGHMHHGTNGGLAPLHEAAAPRDVLQQYRAQQLRARQGDAGLASPQVALWLDRCSEVLSLLGRQVSERLVLCFYCRFC